VKNGQVVKGVHFVNLVDAGDPVAQASFYDAQGADEIVFLDITASSEKRDIMLDVVRRTAEAVFTPLTVGGGIRTVEDALRLLESGADKISINTAAVQDPGLISRCADRFGSQAVVVAVDAKWNGTFWEVFLYGGREATSMDARAWAVRAEENGAGEILLTSMDRDGTKDGYDLDLIRTVSRAVSIPVIASGGCGSMAHIYDAFNQGEADAALAASIFHFRTHSIGEVKSYLNERGIHVRIQDEDITVRDGIPICREVISESTIQTLDKQLFANLKFDANGLIPAVTQDHDTGEVLMLAYMNRESLEETLESGYATYWSRSRQKLWMKGETSGHIQKVQSILIDCDSDALILRIHQTGPACHTGERSCFFRVLAREKEEYPISNKRRSPRNVKFPSSK
jgi:cyclase